MSDTTSSDNGISGQDHTVDTADGPMRLYEAKPPGEARGALVIIQEAFGVNPHIEDVTRRAGRRRIPRGGA